MQGPEQTVWPSILEIAVLSLNDIDITTYSTLSPEPSHSRAYSKQGQLQFSEAWEVLQSIKI